MKRSTLSTKLLRNKPEIALCVVILALVALSARWRDPSESRITVSGLSLTTSLSQAEELLGPADFRKVATDFETWEYWEQKDRPELRIFHLNGEVFKVEGGIPEIDGRDVRHLDLDALQRLLGKPSHSGTGGAVGGPGHTYLAYPQHRLLLQRRGGQTKFILFKSGRG